MRASVALAYLACSCIWGTTYFAIRVSIAPGGYNTHAAAALRFVIAALVLLGIVLIGAIRPRPRSAAQIGWIALTGVLNFGAYALIYKAEESIPGGLACVLYGTLPLMTAILAAMTRTERASPAAVVGALVSLVGIGILFQGRLAVSAAQASGVAMMLGAVFLGTVFNIILKRKVQGVHPLAQTAWFLGTTALAMAILAVAVGQPLPWPPPARPTLAILYLAIVGSVVAFAAFFYLLQHARLMVASTVVLVQPVIALFVDALWETERLNLWSYLGAAVTVFGVGVNLLFTGRSARAPARTERPSS
jgi:drug/metabolite transporter (DMT)-like permease